MFGAHSARIHDNYIDHNGTDEFGGSQFSDGMTLPVCDNTQVWENTLVDNTDIGLVVAGAFLICCYSLSVEG